MLLFSSKCFENVSESNKENNNNNNNMSRNKREIASKQNNVNDVEHEDKPNKFDIDRSCSNGWKCVTLSKTCECSAVICVYISTNISIQSETILTSNHVIRFRPMNKDEETIGLVQIELEFHANETVESIKFL